MEFVCQNMSLPNYETLGRSERFAIAPSSEFDPANHERSLSDGGEGVAGLKENLS